MLITFFQIVTRGKRPKHIEANNLLASCEMGGFNDGNAHEIYEAIYSFRKVIIVYHYFRKCFIHAPPTKELYLYLINLNIYLGAHHNVIFEINLRSFISDFLLTLFFFSVGLELKKEYIAGKLRHRSMLNTAFIICACGVVIPVVTYYIFAKRFGISHDGWAIATTTDTALALGIVYTLMRKINPQCLLLLTSIAVIDDIGGVFIVAFGFTETINYLYLLLSVVITLFAYIAGRKGVTNPYCYLIMGLLTWQCIHLSGVHATIAGLLIAFSIPIQSRTNLTIVAKDLHSLADKIEKEPNETIKSLQNDKQERLLTRAIQTATKGLNPLISWWHKSELWAMGVVLPLFAFVNSAVNMREFIHLDSHIDHLFYGIIIALVIGKPLGIMVGFGFCKKFIQSKQLDKINVHEFMPVVFFFGIGFSMSIFIAKHSMEPHLFEVAKKGIIVGSVASLIMGCTFYACSIVNKRFKLQ